MTIDASSLTVVVDGLAFPEGLRWHDGELWYSDLHEGVVRSLDGDGVTRERIRHAPVISGTGFLPDETSVHSSMRDKRIMRLAGSVLTEHADLSGLPGDFLNDLITDAEGRAYVGTRTRAMSPWDSYAEPGRGPDALVMVCPDGRAEVVASGLTAPNGMVISPDGGLLILAETYAGRLTAFDRTPDGRLGRPRVFAAAPDFFPDGICLDADLAVWAGSPYSAEFVRIVEGGEVTDRVHIPGAVACTFGRRLGEDVAGDRGRLYLACVDPAALASRVQATTTRRPLRGGTIRVFDCAVSGVGWP